MRLAVFPPEERVADVPENVVRDRLLESLKAMSGFEGAYFCIDPISGKGVSVTLWETEKALRDSEDTSDACRRLEKLSSPTRASSRRSK
jgi:hypothetical protein